MFGPRSIWVKRSLVQKEILAQKNYGSQKIGSKTFGQNRVSNSWDIADFEFVWVGGGGGCKVIFV